MLRLSTSDAGTESKSHAGADPQRTDLQRTEATRRIRLSEKGNTNSEAEREAAKGAGFEERTEQICHRSDTDTTVFRYARPLKKVQVEAEAEPTSASFSWRAGEQPVIPGEHFSVEKHRDHGAERQERAERKVLLSPHDLQRDQSDPHR